jgi:hypothetical protein
MITWVLDVVPAALWYDSCATRLSDRVEVPGLRAWRELTSKSWVLLELYALNTSSLLRDAYSSMVE